MADHILERQNNDEPPPPVVSRPQAVRISPRKVLESLSTLRIEITRVILLEAESCKRGASADVIPAMLTPDGAGEPANLILSQHVAIKKLKLDCDTDDVRVLARLAHETSLLNSLSHENIIKVIGFVEDTEDGTAWIVLPWQKNGNLREFIASADWEFPERIALIYDVAKGIEYLHSRESPICHGDLKSLNILVSLRNEAVITDFGSARSVEFASEVPRCSAPSIKTASGPDTSSPKIEVSASRGTFTLTSAQWTLRWAAPELLAGSIPDLASDIWAFGWICWEVMTSNFPFEGENDVSVVLQIVEGKLPPVHGDGRVRQVVALANLIVECWNLHPDMRPNAKLCERRVHWMDRARPCNRGESGSSQFRSAELLSSIAFSHIKHSRFGEAMGTLLRWRNIARSTQDEEAGADIIHSLGDIYRLRGDYTRAEECYAAARDDYSRIGDPLGLANAVNGLGEVYRLRGDFSNAEKSYIIARSIYAEVGDELGFSNAVKALGDVYRLRGKCSEALESYATARDTYARIGNQAGLANSASALGDVYQLQGQYPEAEKSYVDARDVYTIIGDQSGLANTLNALGDVYRLKGCYTKARKSYLDARDIYARIGNRIGVANVVKALGDVYGLRGEYSKAEESYFTAWGTYAKVKDLNGLANAAKALGDVQRVRGDYLIAERFYVSARDVYARVGCQGGLANATKALGDIYRLRKDYSKAKESYLTSRDTYTQIGDQIGLATALTGMGQLFVKLKDFAKAERYYKEAREIYTKIGNKYSLANNLWSTGWMYRSQKRYEEAESVVSEASNLFRELGLENERFECDGFLEAVGTKNPRKWKRVLKARLPHFTH